MKLLKFTQKHWLEIILFTFLFCFSGWLMWHTFDYKDNTIFIASKVWSDFAANIPLIRSFSQGDNWPPEYPLFPGEPIRYHFLFYFLVGILEKTGLPLDWALNLPSALGFFGLCLIIYLLAKLLFNKKSIALLSVIFFLFNGSLAFLEFFKTHAIGGIITNSQFASFGPYDGKIISAFWSLNIYTNQRHLAPAYFLILLVSYLIIKSAKEEKKLSPGTMILTILTLAVLPFFHKVAFMILSIVLFGLSTFLSKFPKQILLILFIVSFLTIPQLAYQFKAGIPAFYFRPGYLMAGKLTIQSIIHYWFLNIGAAMFLIPLGFIQANALAKKVFISFLPLFLAGFLFQYSPEMAANHKFFNMFIIVANIFAALAISKIWNLKVVGKLLAPGLVFIMIFSGIIDFFPVKNDHFYQIVDAPLNPDIVWILKNTHPDSIFLNSSFLYHPASLAGRKIFFGWPYFSWSAGYDMSKRGQIYKQIYESTNKKDICRLLVENNLDYFDVSDTGDNQDLPDIDLEYFSKNFLSSYRNGQYVIYATAKNCKP